MKNDFEDTEGFRTQASIQPSFNASLFSLSSEALTYMKPSVTGDHRKGMSAFILPSQRLARVIPRA